MRLIDADKIDYIMGEKPSSLDYVRRAHIADEPTVKAIPIEWLKKWAETNSNGEWSVEYRTVFNGILKDWKKENDR